MNLTTPSALFSPDGTQWHKHDGPLVWPHVADPQVTKIVIGTPPRPGEDRQAVTLSAPLPADLAARLPQLTHLHLWQIAGLETLPELPAGLQCLDVRGCESLKRLPELPEMLETLVIADCPSAPLTVQSHRTAFPALTELVLRGSTVVEEAWIHSVLRQAPKLRTLDASDCGQITRLPLWAPELVEIRLDGCEALTALPFKWPRQLRRIGLRGARQVRKLPDFPAELDYVDLAHTESLRELPRRRGNPRTLFLFGSGILVPPASEHGEEPNENVATRTAAYFDDVALTGRGEVKRCKLLILGNGSAGKTCLSLALIPGGNPRDVDRYGTTHGIQFWDWDFAAKVDGSMEPVHLHLWDFGGQEIYHNTHRLFMSKGAVFVVVWNPAQDGQQPERAKNDFQDEWRPLQYWLDFIYLACPHKPRIAIVCSHHAAPTEELEKRWRDQVRPEFHDECPCFYIDSLRQAGRLPELSTWLEDEVGQVVAAQGVAVPTYWEIAQNMVESWVKRMKVDADFAADHNQLSPDQFREALGTYIYEAISLDADQRYARLAQSISSREFTLNDDRLRRTLSFLTHSGWVYWDANLFEGRVIVGQEWALQGLYAVLDRRERSPVYRALTRSDGRFTLREVGEWVWNEAGYTPTEQELLRSFMERCGLCFQLRPSPESWREQDVFVSFEHLPTAKELRLQRQFNARLPNLELHKAALAVPRMHKHHWQRFLISAGSHYGKDAQYALDGFYLENKEGEKLLVLCHLHQSGLGGELEIQVGGPDARDRFEAAAGYLKQFFPGGEESGKPDPAQGLGQRAEKEEVFLSYALDPPVRQQDTQIPPGYEVPVDSIEKFLQDQPVILIRDKNDASFGTRLKTFMEYGATRPHVIVVHSDKYWRSPYCIFELWTVMEALKDHRGRSLVSVVIPVEHVASNITKREALEQYLDYWRQFSETPSSIGWQPDELKDFAASLLRSISRDLADHLHLNLRWQDGEVKVLAAIAERLNLPARKLTDGNDTAT